MIIDRRVVDATGGVRISDSWSHGADESVQMWREESEKWQPRIMISLPRVADDVFLSIVRPPYRGKKWREGHWCEMAGNSRRRLPPLDLDHA
jgi:hypothetical protein